MLVIRRTKKCLFGSSTDEEDEKKHKSCTTPSAPTEGLPLISTRTPHAPPPEEAQPQSNLELEADITPVMEPQPDETKVKPQPDKTTVEEPQPDETPVEEPNPDETLVEEPQPDETLVEEPQPVEIPVEGPQPVETPVEEPRPDETPVEEPEEAEPEEDASIRGLREPDGNKLAVITEILGAESSDGGMVKELSEAVKEWSWSYKRQIQRAREAEKLAQRKLPPPIPWYAGRPCRFMKVERSNGRIRMTEMVMDGPPEVMRVVRENGRIRMNLMTYVGDGREEDSAADEPGPSEKVAETCEETTSEEKEEEEEEKEKETDMCGPEAQNQSFVTAT